MPQSCPYCKAWLTTVSGADCPQCGVNLSAPPPNATEVPSKVEVAGYVVAQGARALALLLVIAGFAYALVGALAEENTALSVVCLFVILGCGALLYITTKRLVAVLRSR
jgi:hypothetical protein